MRDKKYLIFAKKEFIDNNTVDEKHRSQKLFINKLEIIFVIQVNTEELHIAYLIQKIVHLKKLL